MKRRHARDVTIQEIWELCSPKFDKWSYCGYDVWIHRERNIHIRGRTYIEWKDYCNNIKSLFKPEDIPSVLYYIDSDDIGPMYMDLFEVANNTGTVQRDDETWATILPKDVGIDFLDAVRSGFCKSWNEYKQQSPLRLDRSVNKVEM